MTDLYRKSEVWKRAGENFLVQVNHYTQELHRDAKLMGEGENRWNVYAYIYPQHPHFAAFDGTETMFQDAASTLPLHRGPSFCRIHIDHSTGEICSYQVGSDYNHLYDDHFCHAETADEAQEVFRDADELFNWLSNKEALCSSTN